MSPERVWQQLTSEQSLSAWELGMRLTWTSPRPFGVGTTREVLLPLRSMRLRERFFRWDEGKRYSFYAESANRPVFIRFAEDYVIEADGDGALLTWTIALEPRSRLRTVTRLLDPVNKRFLGLFPRAAKQHLAA